MEICDCEENFGKNEPYVKPDDRVEGKWDWMLRMIHCITEKSSDVKIIVFTVFLAEIVVVIVFFISAVSSCCWRRRRGRNRVADSSNNEEEGEEDEEEEDEKEKEENKDDKKKVTRKKKENKESWKDKYLTSFWFYVIFAIVFHVVFIYMFVSMLISCLIDSSYEFESKVIEPSPESIACHYLSEPFHSKINFIDGFDFIHRNVSKMDENLVNKLKRCLLRKNGCYLFVSGSKKIGKTSFFQELLSGYQFVLYLYYKEEDEAGGKQVLGEALNLTGWDQVEAITVMKKIIVKCPEILIVVEDLALGDTLEGGRSTIASTTRNFFRIHHTPVIHVSSNQKILELLSSYRIEGLSKYFMRPIDVDLLINSDIDHPLFDSLEKKELVFNYTGAFWDNIRKIVEKCEGKSYNITQLDDCLGEYKDIFCKETIKKIYLLPDAEEETKILLMFVLFWSNITVEEKKIVEIDKELQKLLDNLSYYKNEWVKKNLLYYGQEAGSYYYPTKSLEFMFNEDLECREYFCVNLGTRLSNDEKLKICNP